MEFVIDVFERRVRRLPDAEELVNEGEVPVRAVAPKLGGEVEVGDDGAFGHGLRADFGFRADVLDVDALVFVEEENCRASGADELEDLVFAEVAVEPGFFVESVGFVHNQGAKGVGVVFRERSRTLNRLEKRLLVKTPVSLLSYTARGAAFFVT